MAACIGAAHPNWGERPILLVKVAGAEPPSEPYILEHLGQLFAKWQLPDAIIYVDDIPLTAAGKIDKKSLRSTYQNYLLDQ
jgi:fatty-acyl-CoA synthase